MGGNSLHFYRISDEALFREVYFKITVVMMKWHHDSFFAIIFQYNRIAMSPSPCVLYGNNNSNTHVSDPKNLEIGGTLALILNSVFSI